MGTPFLRPPGSQPPIRPFWPLAAKRHVGAIALIVFGGALGADAEHIEFLSLHPERIIEHRQAWGELGFDAAAHEPLKVGAPLRIGSQTYTNGLGHHATGSLAVWLAGEFERFEAEVGLQPCGSVGSVRFRVATDGRIRFDSGVMRSGDPAQTVDVSVADAQQLTLEALDAGDGIACDMANWANARLTRAATPRLGATPDVDIAPSAAVTTSSPGRLDGARASRIEEYRAEDVFLETALPRNADGTYTLKPDPDGIACIGLNWYGRRALREARLSVAHAEQLPSAATVAVQGWFGESAWQGRWLPLDGAITVAGDTLIIWLSPRGPEGGLLQSRKLRWLIRTSAPSLTVRAPQAFSRVRWADLTLIAEAESPPPGARGVLRVYNGALLGLIGDRPAAPSDWISWELAEPLRFTVRYACPSALQAEATVLEFRLPDGAVGIGLNDLLTNSCVYVPSRGLYVTVATTTTTARTLAEYRRSLAGRKTVLEEVRALPDQTFTQAMARTHHEAQNEGPVMLSLAADDPKYVVARTGEVSFPGSSLTNSDWFAAAGELRAILGDGQHDRATRTLDGGWLPIPLMTFERDGVRVTERAFVSPTRQPAAGSAGFGQPSVCVVEFTLENLLEWATPTRFDLGFRMAGQPRPPAHLQRESDARYFADLGLSQAAVVLDPGQPFATEIHDGSLALSGMLPPRGRSQITVFLGGADVSRWQLDDVARLREGAEAYWRSALAGATQVETPDELLNAVIRSSQVRCLIAARNEGDGARLAPWIAAMAYGPLESEAHSVIRGMDFLGHHDFARRGLEYFIHRYGPNGFLTTGYTTFGTAWHLWTLGEHYQLTADDAWLRRQATELRRVGDWILRQTAKTKRVGPDGEPVPESGLMPPGVLADWNAFAYSFMLNGYYYAALRHLGQALSGAGEPGAATYARGARELRADILRAYQWTQARSPALPLRNGAWIPHYPSQVHSPGPLADFFPGADAGRSWAYDTELGALQLVPTGVLAPDDPEVTRMLDHLEDVSFLGDGWFDYPAAENTKDWFNLGGFAKVQPYYGRSAEVYALRDEVKPFLRSYFNSLASLLNPEVLTLWEHFHHSGAWDKTHETGYFLYQTRTMLVQERGNRLWLAPLIPSDWLAEGKRLVVQNAPTRFGPVSFSILSSSNSDTVRIEFQPRRPGSPEEIVVRLRRNPAAPIRGVEVDGHAHDRFDPEQQTVTVKPTPATMVVRCRR